MCRQKDKSGGVFLVTDQASRQRKWDELEVHVRAAKKASDHGALKSLYFAQAAHLHKYGGDSFSLSQESRRSELRHRLFKMNAELEWFEKYAMEREYTWEKTPSGS